MQWTKSKQDCYYENLNRLVDEHTLILCTIEALSWWRLFRRWRLWQRVHDLDFMIEAYEPYQKEESE